MVAVFAQAFRSWMRAMAIALLATVAFAVGIGSTTAIYTVVNAVMLAPLPYAQGDRFVGLYGSTFSEPTGFSSSTFPDLQEYERRTTSFDAFGWFRLNELNLTSPGPPQHVKIVAVTPGLAHALGVAPLLGQWFTDDTGVVLSHRLWRRLGADPALIGRAATLDGRSLTITGVMPATFRLPVSGPGGEGFESDLWIHLDPAGRGANPYAGYYFAYARRKPGVSLAQAEAEVKRVAVDVAALNPAAHPSYTARLVDLRDASIAGIRPTLLLLFAAAGLLLVITCANVAGLLLARSVARARETATRVALGISQRRLALQYFAEGILVSLAGAAAGVVASLVLVRIVIATGSEFVPRADEIAMDWTVLAFALAVAVVTCLFCSIAPLWQAVRTTPVEALGVGVRASTTARVRRVSQALVVAEIAVAFTLLAVSTALIGHLRYLSRTSPGFDAAHLLTFSLTLPDAIASDDTARLSFQRRLVDAIAAIPGIADAGFASRIPLTGCCISTTIYREGQTVESSAGERTSYVIADPGYFRATQIPLRAGRFLTDMDTSEKPAHVLINQAGASRYWGQENPIDGLGRFGGATGDQFRVIGVVGDVKNNGLGNPTVPEIYLLSAVTTANPMCFVVRSLLPADAIVTEARRAIHTVDPTLPMHDVRTMSDIVRESMALERVGSLMTTFFALAALLMATLGVYGLVAYGVRQRTVEIGTRMALGAVRRDVLSLVIGGGVKMAAAGMVLGGIAVVAALSLITRVFELQGVGWLPFVTSAVIVAAVAAAASSFPAWRATWLSPMVAIRDESQSILDSARTGMRSALSRISHVVAPAAESVTVSESALLAEFVAATRRAESPAEQLRIALATLRSHLNAESVMLLEKAPPGEYRWTSAAPVTEPPAWSLPAKGFLVGRLEASTSALPLTSDYVEALVRWADALKPERRAEVETLKNVGARLAAALRTKNEILGLLLVGPRADGSAYGSAATRALSVCAAQFALMVENSRLTTRVVEQEKLRRDLALAAEVQKRLLPERPPEMASAALAAVSIPARSVGGDYFDFIDVGDKRIGIALADVAGKGVAAALIMSAVQASLRVLLSDTELSLPHLAAKMNRFLHQSTGASSYATFFYAQIDEYRRLRYVNAGHLPPYLLRSTSPVTIQELSTGGAVIGLFPQMAYEEATIDLQPGDVLVAFTDGVTEAMNEAEEEFGEERLKALLQQVVHLSVGEISTRISTELESWIKDAAQYDDLTFVVLKVS